MAGKPAFSAKIKLNQAKLPSSPIHVKISAAPEDMTDVPTSGGSATLKSDARAAFGPATKPMRNPKWAAKSAFRMPSALQGGDEFGG